MFRHLAQRHALGQRAKRVLVRLVAERLHPAFIKRLFGADAMNPTGEPAHLGREPLIAGRIEQRGNRTRRQAAQNRCALPVMVPGVVRIGVQIDFIMKLVERCVELMLERELRHNLAGPRARNVAVATGLPRARREGPRR